MTSNLMAFHRASFSACHCACIATLRRDKHAWQEWYCRQTVSMQDRPRLCPMHNHNCKRPILDALSCLNTAYRELLCQGGGLLLQLGSM